MIGEGWLAAQRPARSRRTLVTPASAQEMWAIVSRPDLSLLSEAAAMVVPVPGSDLLGVIVDAQGGQGGYAFRVVAPLASSEPMCRVTASAGVTTTVRVQPAAAGSRVHLELSATAPRPQARLLRDQFDLVADQWLESLRRVASGVEPFPLPRHDAVLAAALDPAAAAATIPAARTYPVTAQQVWDVIVPSAASLAGHVAAGQLLSEVDERGTGILSEVLVHEPLVRFGSRNLAGAGHPAISLWTLARTGGGTHVTLEHRCASSHVGLSGSVEDRLSALGDRLANGSA